MTELERALELDPALGEGHALSGMIQTRVRAKLKVQRERLAAEGKSAP